MRRERHTGGTHLKNPVNGFLGSPSNLNGRLLLKPNFFLRCRTKFSCLIMSGVNWFIQSFKILGYAARRSSLRRTKSALSAGLRALYNGAASVVRTGTVASFSPEMTLAALRSCGQKGERSTSCQSDAGILDYTNRRKCLERRGSCERVSLKGADWNVQQ